MRKSREFGGTQIGLKVAAGLLLAAIVACGGGGGGGALTPTPPPAGPLVYPGMFRVLASTAAAADRKAPVADDFVKVSPVAGVGSVSSHMQNPRYQHNSAMLPDGRILIMGGDYAYGGDYAHSVSATTDIFDPATESFTPGPPMNHARDAFEVAEVPEGLLIFGGASGWGGGWNMPDEFFRTRTMTFEDLPTRSITWSGGTVHLLPDKQNVLVVGALNPNVSTPMSLADVLSPFLYNWRTGACTWLGQDRPTYYHRNGAACVDLKDGTVLIVGGSKDYSATQTSAISWSIQSIPALTGFIFDPKKNAFTETSPHHIPRNGHTMLLLADGNVGIYGGTSSYCSPMSDYFKYSVEVYDTHAGTFIAENPTPITQAVPQSLDLPGGLTMHTGGQNQSDGSTNTTVFIHDVVKNQAGLTGSMIDSAILRSMIRLNNGLVLITGGEGGTGGILDRGEIFDPQGPLQMSFPEDHVPTGGSLTFSLKASMAVDWTCTAGTVTQDGVFKAPIIAGDVWIRATKKTDATVFVQARIHVYDVAPADISYARNPILCTLNQAISPDAALVGGGNPTLFSVVPALPTGLVLDPGTGTISGTPTFAQIATDYDITASNGGGSTDTVVSITIQ